MLQALQEIPSLMVDLDTRKITMNDGGKNLVLVNGMRREGRTIVCQFGGHIIGGCDTNSLCRIHAGGIYQRSEHQDQENRPEIYCL